VCSPDKASLTWNDDHDRGAALVTGGRPQAKEKTMAGQDELLLGVEDDTVVARRESNGDNDGGDSASDFV
jgi:hypothetical protein